MVLSDVESLKRAVTPARESTIIIYTSPLWDRKAFIGHIKWLHQPPPKACMGYRIKMKILLCHALKKNPIIRKEAT